jgi:hypothetical protein
MWNSGPPYLATVSDMWSEYTQRVLDVFPKLFAEMYGFVTATVQLELPMTLVRSMVVSGPSKTTLNREGWPYIDALPDDQVYEPLSLQQQQQQESTKQSNTIKLPMILHYCQEYSLGKVRTLNVGPFALFALETYRTLSYTEVVAHSIIAAALPTD